jgi:hypothetical protein
MLFRTASAFSARVQAVCGGALLILGKTFVLYSSFMLIGCFSSPFLLGGRHKVNKLLE